MYIDRSFSAASMGDYVGCINLGHSGGRVYPGGIGRRHLYPFSMESELGYEAVSCGEVIPLERDSKLLESILSRETSRIG